MAHASYIAQLDRVESKAFRLNNSPPHTDSLQSLSLRHLALPALPVGTDTDGRHRFAATQGITSEVTSTSKPPEGLDTIYPRSGEQTLQCDLASRPTGLDTASPCPGEVFN